MERLRLKIRLVQRPQGVKLFRPQDRRAQVDPAGVMLGLLQEAAAHTQIPAQGHHDLFADRVDGRVRHLGEPLLEVVVEKAGVAGEHGQRRIVPHGARRLLPSDTHLPEDVTQLLGRIAERLLQFDVDRGRGFLPRFLPLNPCDVILQLHHVLLHPEGVRTAGEIRPFGVLVGMDNAFLGVHRENFPRVELPLSKDARVVHLNDPRLRSHDNQSVGRDGVTGGAETVPVDDGPDHYAV